MLDASQLFLFFEIIYDSPAWVEIGFHGFFIDIMKQIEIKIINIAFCQLLFKYLSRIVSGAADLMSRIFGCKIKTVTGIFAEHMADHALRFAIVVRICGVKIVYAMIIAFLSFSVFDMLSVYNPVVTTGQVVIIKNGDGCI